MVITAGTRNHFALDLGLDRENPAACPGALSDGIDLQVNLGVTGGQTFVNNASFGAYAEVVQTPAYRDDKLATTLNLLPDLLDGHRGARLSARADRVEITAPQALLVANNPYGTGDIAGLSRRARLDGGLLGVVGFTVDSARQAVGLLRGTHGAGLSTLVTTKIEINADAPRIPVGTTARRCRCPPRCCARSAPARSACGCRGTVPGSHRPSPPLNWGRLWHLAAPLKRQLRRSNSPSRGA